MKTRIKAFSMSLLMLLLTLATSILDVTTVLAADDLTLVFHYYRADENYDGWDVWMWEEGAEGADYSFEEEDGDMVVVKTITPGATSVGFIIKTTDWAKDFEEDQFIDISEMVSGTVHIYVESGVEGYTKEYGDDAITGTKLTTAKYDGEKTITVTMSGTLEGNLNDVFTVKGSNGGVAIAEITADKNNEYTITLTDPLEAAGSYYITYEGNEYNIIMPNIYSTDAFEADYTYNGDDLGAVWTNEKTTFRVWAPTADAVTVNLYQSGTEDTDDLIEQLTMTPDKNGTWTVEKSGDLQGTYYTYLTDVNGTQNEACDPYARTTGVNGKRAMVINLAVTNPDGWDTDSDPHAGASFNDAIIYELHVRDLSSDSSSGITNTGKFLGLTETGTKTESGIPTGLDHIKDLGITHLHLLPSYDYGSVDETKLETPQFNWGYDPVNYNVPEGSYSTDPYNGEVRVKEMKQMVQSLHKNDISVILDVVYNHVQSAGDFCFNQIVPGYFSRIDENGRYSNGSGCGNDTASERSMVKKYIVDSVKYWADEYHIDGFRFDLVGLIDTETINEIITEVHKDHPNVLFYGEGWSMPTELTKEGYTLATQVNSEELPAFAFFSDTLRDALKGSVFSSTELGFISGAPGLEDTIEQCFMGMAPTWCTTPAQAINYASCHDNLSLMDRITRSTPNASPEDRIRMNNLAAAIYLTAEGIPFMQAGEEFLRSKVKPGGGFDENSYSSPDSVNSLKWDLLDDEQYQDVYNYYKGLIAFRKAYGELRLTTAEEVTKTVTPMEGLDENVVAFHLDGEATDGMFVIFNANNANTEVTLPAGTWDVCINDEKAGTDVIETITGGKVTVSPVSAMVLVKGEAADSDTIPVSSGATTNQVSKTPIIIAVAVIAAIILIGAIVFIRTKKNS